MELHLVFILVRFQEVNLTWEKYIVCFAYSMLSVLLIEGFSMNFDLNYYTNSFFNLPDEYPNRDFILSPYLVLLNIVRRTHKHKQYMMIYFIFNKVFQKILIIKESVNQCYHVL